MAGPSIWLTGFVHSKKSAGWGSSCLRRCELGTLVSAALERSWVGVLVEVVYSATSPVGARISRATALGLGARFPRVAGSSAAVTPKRQAKTVKSFMVNCRVRMCLCCDSGRLQV
jgi:hypothetical protein